LITCQKSNNKLTFLQVSGQQICNMQQLRTQYVCVYLRSQKICNDTIRWKGQNNSQCLFFLSLFWCLAAPRTVWISAINVFLCILSHSHWCCNGYMLWAYISCRKCNRRKKYISEVSLLFVNIVYYGMFG